MIVDLRIRVLPVSFVFVGDGEQRDQLVEMKSSYALERLYIVDPVAHEAVPSLIRQADILIMSYRDTGEDIAGMIGSKFFEYCASSKPVIVHGPGVASAVGLLENRKWVGLSGRQSGGPAANFAGCT